MNKFILFLKTEGLYIISTIYRIIKKRNINIMSIEETIAEINEKQVSIIRFGDGEFSIMQGENIDDYQVCEKKLRDGLVEAAMSFEIEKILICMPETLSDLSICNKASQKRWSSNFFKNRKVLDEIITEKYKYGNAFFSRPYMIYVDKSRCDYIFKRIISLFCEKDILIVEGKYSRNGVGNDLFARAKSLERIICPNENAFAKYDEILAEIVRLGRDKLVLLSIGPSSKPLGLELVKRGYWVIDIGHIDSEYEWFLKRADRKIEIPHKHTAENKDNDIDMCLDQGYIKSIVATIE